MVTFKISYIKLHCVNKSFFVNDRQILHLLQYTKNDLGIPHYFGAMKLSIKKFCVTELSITIKMAACVVNLRVIMLNVFYVECRVFIVALVSLC